MSNENKNLTNKVYFDKKIKKDMVHFFTENGFIQLNQFLKTGYKEFREKFEKSNLIKVYEPLYQSKQMLDLKEIYDLELIKIIEYFKSKEFTKFIEEISEFDLILSKFEVNQYSHKDFIILNDKTPRDETISVIYDISDQFSEDMGGTLTFTTKEEEVFYLEPEFNSLSIFYNPEEIMKYLKYVNNKSKGLKIIRIEMEFSFHENEAM